MENINAEQEKDVQTSAESGVSPEMREEVSRFVDDLGEWNRTYREKA